MISSFFRISLQHMIHRKLRSWLTIIGIVIGIMAIISLITLGQGFENAIEEQFAMLGTNTIRIVPESLTGPPVGYSPLEKDDVDTIESVPGVDFVTPLVNDYGELKYKDEGIAQFVIGFDTSKAKKSFESQGIEFVEGRSFDSGETGVVLLGYGVAKDYYESEIRAKNSVYINGHKLKVLGIMEKQGDTTMDSSVYISMKDSEEIFGETESVNVIVAYLDDGVVAEEVGEDIMKVLERKKGNDHFEVFSASQLLDQLGSILQIVQAVLAGIAAISLLVGGIGIMNSMYTSVLERMKEIGTMKAIGAKASEIFTLFLIEAGLVGVVGGSIGIALGIGVAYAVQFYANLMNISLLSIEIQLPVVLFALGFAFTVGVVSGTLPAYRASKLHPVDALRYE